MFKSFRAEMIIFLIAVSLALFFGHDSKIEGEVLDWPENGLYVAPYTCYIFDVLKDHQVDLPIIVIGDSINNYRFISLQTKNGEQVPIKEVSISPKIKYSPRVQLYLVQLRFSQKPSTICGFSTLNYMGKNQKLKTNIQINYETGQLNNVPFKPWKITTNEDENLMDLEVSNNLNGKIRITDVTVISSSIRITEKKIIRNNIESDINETAPVINPSEQLHIVIKFVNRNQDASVEIGPKIVYKDSKGNLHSTSIFTTMYPGDVEPATLIQYFAHQRQVSK